MKTLAALAVAITMSAGGALAQDGGEAAPGGFSTGREAGALPTPEQCQQGWDASMRMTEAEFDIACDNQ